MYHEKIMTYDETIRELSGPSDNDWQYKDLNITTYGDGSVRVCSFVVFWEKKFYSQKEVIIWLQNN